MQQPDILTSRVRPLQMYIRTLHSSLVNSNSISSTLFKHSSRSVFPPIASIRMASSHQHSKRRFAPLGQPGSDGAPALRGIVFDMDGTLCTSHFLRSFEETCVGHRYVCIRHQEQHDTILPPQQSTSTPKSPNSEKLRAIDRRTSPQKHKLM